MSWTPPALQRHEALADYLAELGLEYSEECADREVPAILTLSGHSIELEPWERTLLQESLSNHSSQGRRWAPLLAEGLAFQMKCKALLEPPTPVDDGSPILPVRLDLEELITDAAVGLALLQETQRAIDQMVVAGGIAEAKKLTAFRNRIGQTVSRLKDEIGEVEFPRAENKAEGMVAPAEHQASLISRSTGPDPVGAGSTWKGQRKSSPSSIGASTRSDDETRNRIGSLATLLIVLTIVWAVFILPRILAEKPHILQTAEFTDVPGIVSTVAKPPSVYITVEAGRWNDMPRQDRKAMIAEIGKVAEEQGYVGADIRDDEGTVIGRWLKTGGASLVDP